MATLLGGQGSYCSTLGRTHLTAGGREAGIGTPPPPGGAKPGSCHLALARRGRARSFSHASCAPQCSGRWRAGFGARGLRVDCCDDGGGQAAVREAAKAPRERRAAPPGREPMDGGNGAVRGGWKPGGGGRKWARLSESDDATSAPAGTRSPAVEEGSEASALAGGISGLAGSETSPGAGPGGGPANDEARTPGPLGLKATTVRARVGNREIVVETGMMGRQANGAVTVRDGDTVLYATACMADEESEPSDFVPLTVNYQERFSAGGKTMGGFLKREGRPRDQETLVARLIDRPIRPMIAKGFNYETQILQWVLSYDEVNSPEALAITAAGAALAVSDIPLLKPVAGVRVGLVGGEYVVNPTKQQMAGSRLDMIVAGTADAVLMIEGYGDLLSEGQLLDAVETGQAAIASICAALAELAAKAGKPKRMDLVRKRPAGLSEQIKSILGGEMERVHRTLGKKERTHGVKELQQRLLAHLTPQGQSKAVAAAVALAEREAQAASEEALEKAWDEEEDIVVEDGEVDEGEVKIVAPSSGAAGGGVEKKGRAAAPDLPQVFDQGEVMRAFKEFSSHEMRRLVVTEGVRSDGRGPRDVRPIESSCGLLPRTHGSALFTRGETQALCVATLGGSEMGQRQDGLTLTDVKRFYLQYTFPPSSVGETGRVGGVSRREIGHGTLAERALVPCIPEEDAFPYTIRLESTILESNGSSSMASVCGGCLALLDAGVPVTTRVAGIAMGLILDTASCGGDGRPLVLSDILGSEDALGDMDFKVAGDETGVTAFQMDIKVEGITLAVLEEALAQAGEGRRHILGEMAKCHPPPARSLSAVAPRISTMQINPEKVGMVIGSGGKTMRAIIDGTGIESIDINDDGRLTMTSKSEEGIQMARERIKGMIMVPEVGKIYRRCLVKNVVQFGCFVEIAPGKEGLVHISELTSGRLSRVEDFVNEGDYLDVKLMEINARGQLRLSHKAARAEEERGAAAAAAAKPMEPLVGSLQAEE